jgi:hypothetical protein
MNYAVIAASIKKTIIGRKTKLIIAALLLAASSAFAQVPSYVPTNGLVGWWPFNGNANNENGNGNNGTVVNGNTPPTLISDRFGYANSAYHFQGGYITCGRPSFADFQTSSFSISIWFKTNQNNGISNDYFFIYYGQYATVNSQWGIRNYVNGIINASIYTNGGAAQSANSYADNLWHNAIFVRNIATLSVNLYIDGQLVNTNNFPYASNIVGSNQAQLYFGGLPWAPTFADIDDIGIWNRALSQQEINSVYTTCTGTGVITADGTTTFCAGNFVNLTSDVVGGTYQWKKNGVNITTNGTSKTFKASTTGSYTCVATCNGTALTSNAISVTSKTNAAASVSASGATSFCAGDSVTLNCTNLGSNYSVQWYRTNISMENATAYSQVVKQPGTYKVVTKNLTNGCSRISGSSVVVAVNCRLANPDVVVVENDLNDEAARTIREDMPEVIRIYPNPNEGSFTFEFQTDEEGAGDFQIINIMGQSIYNAIVTSTDGFVQHQINLGNQFETGLYIVRYKLNGEQYDRKVILK